MKLIANEILLNLIAGGSNSANDDDSSDFYVFQKAKWPVEGGLIDWPPLPAASRFPANGLSSA